MILAQIGYIFAMKNTALWDTLDVVTAAKRMLEQADPMIPSNGGYFEMYGNNNFMVIMLYFFYRLMTMIGIKNLWTASMLLNAAVIDLGIFLSCWILKRWGKKTAFIGLLLWIFSPYPYVYTGYVYTNTFSIAAIAGELYLAFSLFDAIKEEKWRKAAIRSAVFGAVGAMAFSLRATNLIIIIACAVAGAAYVIGRGKMNTQDIRRIGVAVVAFAVVFGMTSMLWKRVESQYVSPEMKEKNFPITHWIAMGANFENKGSFYQPDEDETRSLVTKEEKTENTIEKIKDRYYCLLFEGKLGTHLINKLKNNWSIPTRYLDTYVASNTSFGLLYHVIGGEGSAFFRVYFQLFTMAIQILVCISFAWGYLSKNVDYVELLLVIALFGIHLFYLIWEVNYIYNVCFMGVFFMLCAYTYSKEKVRPVLKRKETVLVAIVAGMLLLNAVTVETGNYKENYDHYAVFGNFRRPHIEDHIYDLAESGGVLEQSFTIREGKSFNQINLNVENLDDAISGTYLFTLYNAETGNVEFEKVLCGHPEIEGVYPLYIELPDVYGPGKYRFTVQGNTGERDTLAFRYHHDLVDNNPGGYLTVGGNDGGKLDDLVMNILLDK